MNLPIQTFSTLCNRALIGHTMILRQLSRVRNTRLYHDSVSRKPKLPVVRFANSRVKRANELQRHSEASPRIPNEYQDDRRRFEPFPFKVDEDNKIECLRRKVTPLYDIPYEEQLTVKENFCKNALRQIGQELYRSGTPVRMDMKRLPCQINPIVRSPQITHYRNKDEFSIWRGHDGKTITVGYMIFPVRKHGDTVCVEPSGCDVIKDESNKAVEIFQEFLNQKAQLGVSYDLGTEGGWRRLAVRVNLDGDLMVIGVLNPRTYKVRQVLEERDNFKEFMVERCREAGLKLASLYYQPCPHNKCPHKDVPYELLHGDKTITESIGDFRVQISPESFLHHSSIGAEVLYDTIKSTIKECFLTSDEGELSSVKPIILDANCGLGLLSINLASLAERVIGVDSSPQSINDAIANAAANNIRNVEFVNSDLEIVMGRIIGKHVRQRRDLVVVCDVTNSGLHPNVIEVLRHSREVDKILLIIPKISSPNITDNIVRLCSKGHGKSLPPYAPILATPVDVYPQVEQFHTILALNRLPQ